MLLVVLSFGRLQIEPRIAEGLDVRQEGFDKWMELILGGEKDLETGERERENANGTVIMGLSVYGCLLAGRRRTRR